jgi:hypothetical protein
MLPICLVSLIDHPQARMTSPKSGILPAIIGDRHWRTTFPIFSTNETEQSELFSAPRSAMRSEQH